MTIPSHGIAKPPLTLMVWPVTQPAEALQR